jgi:hypothetical protein
MSELKSCEDRRSALEPWFVEFDGRMKSSTPAGEGDVDALRSGLLLIAEKRNDLTGGEFAESLKKLLVRANKPADQRLINEATVQRILAVDKWAREKLDQLDRWEQETNGLIAEVEAKRQRRAAAQQLQSSLDQLGVEESGSREQMEQEAISAYGKMKKALKEKLKKCAANSKRVLEREKEQQEAKHVLEVLRPLVDGLSEAEMLKDERLNFEDEEDDERDQLLHEEVVERRTIVNAAQEGKEAVFRTASASPSAHPPDQPAGLRTCGRATLNGKTIHSLSSSVPEWRVLSINRSRMWIVECGEGSEHLEAVGGYVAAMCLLSPELARWVAAQGDLGRVSLRNSEAQSTDNAEEDGGPLSTDPEHPTPTQLQVAEGAEGMPFRFHTGIAPKQQGLQVGVLLAHGGYFASGVYSIDSGKWIVHKTMSRYVCRRGQGGRQSAHDGRTDTAGSQIRAFQEKKYMEDIHRIIEEWDKAGHWDRCQAILYHAPGTLNLRSVYYDTALSGERLKGKVFRVPVTTGRPLLSECEAVLDQVLRLSLAQYTDSSL